MPSKKPKPKLSRDLWRHFNQLLLSVCLFVVATLLSRNAAMDSWEAAVFRAIYGLPDWLNPIFLGITQLGSMTVLFALAVVYLIVAHYRVALRLLMSGLLAYIMAGTAKELVGRSRPQALLDNIIYRDLFAHGPGFPSGHAALATAIALTAGRYLPSRYIWIVPVWIIGVSISRIYLGVHAPLDVIGGIAIGWFSAEVFRAVKLRGLAKKLDKNSR